MSLHTTDHTLLEDTLELIKSTLGRYSVYQIVSLISIVAFFMLILLFIAVKLFVIHNSIIFIPILGIFITLIISFINYFALLCSVDIANINIIDRLMYYSKTNYILACNLLFYSIIDIALLILFLLSIIILIKLKIRRFDKLFKNGKSKFIIFVSATLLKIVLYAFQLILVLYGYYMRNNEATFEFTRLYLLFISLVEFISKLLTLVTIIIPNFGLIKRYSHQSEANPSINNTLIELLPIDSPYNNYEARVAEMPPTYDSLVQGRINQSDRDSAEENHGNQYQINMETLPPRYTSTSSNLDNS